MFCIKCGTQLPDEAAFCFACGASVFKAEDAAPVVAQKTETEFEARVACEADGKPEVSTDAVVEIGNLFIENGKMYFITHGYKDGLHSQLWVSDMDGVDKKCLLDFDTTDYKPVCDIESDDSYYIAKIDSLLVLKVFDKDYNSYNYYYDIERDIHGILENTPSMPRKVSQNGKYFVECRRDNENEGAVILSLLTPYGFINNKPRERFVLKPGNYPVISEKYSDISFSDGDCYVLNNRVVLIAFYGDAKYLWLKINLDDWTDTVAIHNENFMIEGTLIGEDNVELFKEVEDDSFALIDTDDMSIRSCVAKNFTSVVNKYGSQVHITAYDIEDDIVLDLRTGAKKTIEQNVVSFEKTGIHNVRQTTDGYYKYSYKDGDTKILFIPNEDLFQITYADPYDDNERVYPTVSLSYVKEFVRTTRDDFYDDNVYTYENTYDLKIASCMYLRAKNEECFKKVSEFDFYIGRHITLSDGKRVGFVYGHKPNFEGCKNYYYNLYELDLDGEYKFLNCGSRGGVEFLMIYKNYAYWADSMFCRYDFNTGEFIESREDWIREEYENVKNMASTKQL